MAESSKQHIARSTARRKAMQLLFESEITGTSGADMLANDIFIDEVGIPCDFTKMLLQGVCNNIETIDALIVNTSEHWSLERMPIVDKTILRLATFEMLYADDIPHSVSINEAVELAKRFGGEDDSSRFVNGVLGQIASSLTEQAQNNGQDGQRRVLSKREKKAING